MAGKPYILNKTLLMNGPWPFDSRVRIVYLGGHKRIDVQLEVTPKIRHTKKHRKVKSLPRNGL